MEIARRGRAAVLKLGVRPQLAANMPGSGRGPWYLSLTKAINTGRYEEYFSSLGLHPGFRRRAVYSSHLTVSQSTAGVLRRDAC